MFNNSIWGVLGIVALILDRVSKSSAHELIVRSTVETQTWLWIRMPQIDFGLPSYPSESLITYHPILNSGVAFGILLPRALLIFLTIVLIVGIVSYWYRELSKLTVWQNIGIYMLLIGAGSNAYDRIIQGYVVDFISITYFAICNVADILICVWAVMLIIFSKSCKPSNSKTLSALPE